ncbi:2-C-methyl-D-erythritol 4-phosphate cytidylyltransferase [candidate division WOR-3 bacterium]|nr:2-C-methyl-D-erythritol 4-phosphate cytidylyltransferase [candidate division WOR-3 bacterium]
MANHAIIVAAGAGKRFGGKKQFMRIHGLPLFVYATRAFDNQSNVSGITIVVPKKDIKTTRKQVRDFGFKKVHHVVAGGRRRQDSVVNGLRTIRDKSGVVIIHDAVRPLVSSAVIRKGIALCRKHKSVIIGTKVHDTMKRVAKRLVQETIPRDDLFLVQTPQFYDIRTIKQAIAKADFRMEYTDEASILESLGMPVYVFQGDRHNIKVTDKKDLRYIQKHLA